MARRSTPKSKQDDRTFPVRIRVAVPAEGLGNTLMEMHAWLTATVGKEGYAFHGGRVPGYEDAMLVYLQDVEIAAELVRRFDLKVGVDRR